MKFNWTADRKSTGSSLNVSESNLTALARVLTSVAVKYGPSDSMNPVMSNFLL